MTAFRRFIFCLICLLPAITMICDARKIKGTVYGHDQKPLAGVNVVNIFTEKAVYTDRFGRFRIKAKKGHTIEFQKLGYQVKHTRFDSTLKCPLDIRMKEQSYIVESTGIEPEQRTVFKRFPCITPYTLREAGIMQPPQERYWPDKWLHCDTCSKDQLIDSLFNSPHAIRITKLDSADVIPYLKLYRPKYELVKTWSGYDFFQYLLNTAAHFRRTHGYRDELIKK